jgi:membrane protein implicated in regulation of membrane protease activity
MSYGLWFIVGGLLIVTEILAPGFVLVWFGLAALLTGGLVFLMPDLVWHLQALAFAVLSLSALGMWFLFRGRLEQADDEPGLNRRGTAAVGRRVVIETAIQNGRGSARLGDGIWSVRGPDAPIGTVMTVVRAEGTVLVVEPADKAADEAKAAG